MGFQSEEGKKECNENLNIHMDDHDTGINYFNNI